MNLRSSTGRRTNHGPRKGAMAGMPAARATATMRLLVLTVLGVPLLVVSPWANGGTIDHQRTQDFDFTKTTPLALPALQQRTTTPNGDAGCVTY